MLLDCGRPVPVRHGKFVLRREPMGGAVRGNGPAMTSWVCRARELHSCTDSKVCNPAMISGCEVGERSRMG